MKRVYLIHGWEGSSQSNWIPWLKKQLEATGVQVFALDMPNPHEPDIATWVAHMRIEVMESDADTYFVGHSMGCQAILRYLEELPEDEPVGGVLLVAGFFEVTGINDPKDQAMIAPWVKTPMDFERILQHTRNIIALFSDDDKYVPLSNVQQFAEKLGAKTITESSQGHFQQKEAPKILEELKALLSSS